MIQIIAAIALTILGITMMLLHFGCITMAQTVAPVVITLIIAVLIPLRN